MQFLGLGQLRPGGETILTSRTSDCTMSVIIILSYQTSLPKPAINTPAPPSDRMIFHLLRIKRQLIRQLTPKDKEDGTTLLYELYMTWIVKSFQNSVTRSGRQSWFLLYLFLFVEQASVLVDIHSFHFDCCFFRLVAGSAAQVYLVEFPSRCILNHDYRVEYFVNCILSSRKALLMPSSSSVSTRGKSCK